MKFSRKTKRIGVTLSVEAAERLRVYADVKKETMSFVLEELIEGLSELNSGI